MSVLDQKTYDIILEEGADFGLRLRLKETELQCTQHPVTGNDENCVEVETPINLTYQEFTGSIADSLEDSATDIGSFTFQKTDAVNGVVDMSLGRAEVTAMLPYAQPTRDKYSPRIRFLGYYDVLVRDTQSDVVTRIMQGKVYFSDGVV
ncbi:tail protein [Vibrio phage vB_VpS_PG07]|uniref:Tail protein n=1 Tax=Vibrio phage vB_VpS_PG07 TaxID=2301664 RepID=A0A385E7P8_9CAUD|nr:tail protein [Vibrio phage vB_VpS_PG07]AXQ66749.1 tail protein [Vibrio phage vB_VpS_PG07]